MSKLGATRWALIVLVLAFVSTACPFGGGGTDLAANADDVKAPDEVAANLTALPGLVLNTNSKNWQRMLHASDQPGVVVLFVQPSGPSDRKGIARGDVLVEIDGDSVTNHENAVARLRSTPRQKRELKFIKTDGSERTVEVTARNPAPNPLPAFLTALIKANPSDALWYFIRSTTGTEFKRKVADADKALSIDPEFVEAMSHKASLKWDRRIVEPKNALGLANEALAGWKSALDIDPDHITTITVQSNAITSLNNVKQGKEDAQRAVEIDDTYPRAWFALGAAERRAKKPKEALAPLANAVKLNPFSMQYWRVLAELFNTLGRDDDCRKTVNAITPFLRKQGLTEEIDKIKKRCE